MDRKFRDDDRTFDQYLREIGKIPLLSADEEVQLTRKIKAGDKQALQTMIKSNLRFVVSVAKHYQNQGIPMIDLINEGNIGLIKAAKRFDERRGFKFISYAVWWIRQAILQALAEHSRIVRLPLNRVSTFYQVGKVSALLVQRLGREPSDKEIAQELNLSDKEVAEALKMASSHISLDAPFAPSEDNSLLDVLEDEHQPSPDEDLLRYSLKDEIKKVLDTLTPREAEVIKLYFGLDGEKSLTLEEIGARFSLTRERIRQIKEKAIKRLRQKSRHNVLKAYLT